MAKLIIVVDEDKIGTDRIYYKADAIFRLSEDASTFEIEKYRPYAYSADPYVLKDLPSFIRNCSEVKQDSWLVEDGYIGRSFYKFINCPIELSYEITVTLKPEGQDDWLIKDGYL